LGEESNVNRPPSFTSDHYDFRKIRIQMFLEAQGSEIWKAFKNGPHIPTTVLNGVSSLKLETSWDEDGHKKVIYYG
jgi:hypothetical protein